jgi:hypothetical protein
MLAQNSDDDLFRPELCLRLAAIGKVAVLPCGQKIRNRGGRSGRLSLSTRPLVIVRRPRATTSRRAPMIAFTDEQIAGKRQQSILQSARKPSRLNTPIL